MITRSYGSRILVLIGEEQMSDDATAPHGLEYARRLVAAYRRPLDRSDMAEFVRHITAHRQAMERKYNRPIKMLWNGQHDKPPFDINTPP
jgi:hypothetical protein